MPTDLVFRDLSIAQAMTLLQAADKAGVAPVVAPFVMKFDPVDPERAATSVARAIEEHKGPAQEKVFPGKPEDVAAPAPAAAVKREPGSDDGPPLTEADAAYFRAPTVKAIVKMMVGTANQPDADQILRGCQVLRARGVAALEAVPEEQLADRVAGSLAALGF